MTTLNASEKDRHQRRRIRIPLNREISRNLTFDTRGDLTRLRLNYFDAKLCNTGLERGLPLRTLLTAVWTDSSFSPHFFDHIAATYMTRSMLYFYRLAFFVDAVLCAQGGGGLPPPDLASFLGLDAN